MQQHFAVHSNASMLRESRDHIQDLKLSCGLPDMPGEIQKGGSLDRPTSIAGVCVPSYPRMSPDLVVLELFDHWSLVSLIGARTATVDSPCLSLYEAAPLPLSKVLTGEMSYLILICF